MLDDIQTPCAEAISREQIVSVIIPVYNVSRYLRQCLDSVSRQTYTNLEIIVIDDGATDGSGEICDEYAKSDTRIRVFHTENRGLASARNLGLDNMSGSYILFIDSDDWLELNAIDLLLKVLIQTNADAVAFNNLTEYVGNTIHSNDIDGSITVFQGRSILEAYSNGMFRNVSWNKLYRAACFSNIRFPVGHNYEDGYVTWRQMKILAEEGGKVTKYDKELIHIRMRNGSISHTMSMNNVIDYWDAYHERYNSLPEFKDRLIILCFSGIGRMWLNYYRFSTEDRRNTKNVVMEMKTFSKAHFRQVMRGNYSRNTKLICFLSQSSAKPIMWICYCGGKLLESNERKKRKLFV